MRSLWNLCRRMMGSANKAIKDDVADGQFAIEDSEEQIKSFRKDIAGLMANQKSVERDLQSAKKDVIKWAKIQELAIDNEKDRNEAAQEVTNAKRRAVELKRQKDANDKSIATLRDQLDKADQKVRNAKSNHSQLAARQKSAKIRKDLASSSSKFGSGGALAALDDLKDSVEANEDMASAMEEMTNSASESLEEKYSANDAATDADYEKLFENDN